MNIDELTKNLSDRAVALELITWLRENELLADNSGNEVTDTDLAETFAFHSPEESEILAQIHQLLTASTQTILPHAIAATLAASKFSKTIAWEQMQPLKLVTLLSYLPQEEKNLITVALTSLLQAEGENFFITERQVNLAASILYAVGKRSVSTI